VRQSRDTCRIRTFTAAPRARQSVTQTGASITLGIIGVLRVSSSSPKFSPLLLNMSTGPVAVYCASSNGTDAAHQNAARSVGRAVARRGLVYGGGSSGLMGVVSQATLDAGGHVVGIVPAAMLAKKPGFSKGGPSTGEGSKVDVPVPTPVATDLTTKEELGVVKKHGEPVLLVEKGREAVSFSATPRSATLFKTQNRRRSRRLWSVRCTNARFVWQSGLQVALSACLAGLALSRKH